MTWLKRLFALLSRERIAEEQKADELFRAQIAEALLRQDDLREAAAQMKKVSEGQSPESDAFRSTLRSRPT